MTTEATKRQFEFAAALENDNLPVLGRMYEVEAARELEMQESIEAPVQTLQPGADTPHTLHSQDAVDNLDDRQNAEFRNEMVMPFIGQILQHIPGESIIIERVLNLAEDLYLADHAFVHAQGVKPLAACLPVLPMTFSLEVMAEAAACLVPGFGLIGLEDIKATRWIELADTDKLTVRITAGQMRLDPDQQIYRIEAAIYIVGQTMPAISANVVFASYYQLDLTVGFTQLTGVKQLPAEQVYQERHMFHGPRLQCLVGEILLGDHGAAGELLTRSAGNLFRSAPNPQLLLDPALLDGVGQLLGIWAMEQRERSAFPIGFKKLELYQPTPPAGTRVPVRIEITRDEVKTLHADIEIQDGAGNVWMRIHDWGMWKFRWAQKLLDFRRLPTQYLVSDPVTLPSLAPATICRILSSSGLTGFDAGLLARYYLHMDEFPAFTGKAGIPQRQHQWLLGRIVAKDAVRAWIAACTHTEEMLHPASFTIENDERGQPVVRRLAALEPLLPKISIAHCEDRAIAIAQTGPVGVDIEKISSRNPGFLETITSEAERALFSEHVNMDDSSEKMEEWITRLWCAKEVVGKLMGTGVTVPRHFEVTAIAIDGTIRILPQGSDRPVFVSTTRDNDFIIAHAITRARIA
ncbi:MAG: polyketide synthase dehydratase domain-containing protein [Methylobacter sp.]|nr:polyketide synthase dehydratase domain-containing protein [Methylobacter sp.]